MDLSHKYLEYYDDINKSDAQDEYSASLNDEYNMIQTFGIIDMNQINFEGDEIWLHKPLNMNSSSIVDLHDWLYEETDSMKDETLLSNKLHLVCEISKREAQKSIDTRTFTRPKKRFTRPSIEKYNEQVYGSTKLNSSECLNDTNTIQEESNTPTKPLNFDLAQPTSSYYFENVLAKASEIDSFQNMSPPSLVNSMCSSTFANLMDSSFIKNDPVLREIRDTDFTETILLQDSEPPMFQSFTESCSSINSDTPESFLKRISHNGTFKKSLLFEKTDADKDNFTVITSNNDTGVLKENGINNENNSHLSNLSEEYHDAKQNQSYNLNGTYRRSPKLNHTFRKSDVSKDNSNLNATFQLQSKENSDIENILLQTTLHSSNNLPDIVDSIEKDRSKSTTNRSYVKDLNRLSYCVDTQKMKDDTANKRSSLVCSNGSAESLDRMSSHSGGSSKGSNKFLNMADVDAIVQMQERSLPQVMSTPKPNIKTKQLFENNFISPIVLNEPYYDSDNSSNEDYKSTRSTLSKTSLDSCKDIQRKTGSYPILKTTAEPKKPARNLYSLANTNNLQNMNTKIRGSYGDLKAMSAQQNMNRGSYSDLHNISSNLRSSQSNLYKPAQSRPASNLKTMGHRLKGSYTSLKPISANLPVAPPIVPTLNSTTTYAKSSSDPNVTHIIEGHTKIAEVPPIPREKHPTSMGDNVFVKPQQPRASGLPRPLGSATGIPRPSKIPGPRTGIRPVQSRLTKLGKSEGYY